MTTDPYGGPFRTACTCHGDRPAARRTSRPSSAAPPAARQGRVLRRRPRPRPRRLRHGARRRAEPRLRAASSSRRSGPAVNGTSDPVELAALPDREPAERAIEPQRDAGRSIEPRAARGADPHVRTTEAREQTRASTRRSGSTKLRGLGDSFWADWTSNSQPVTGTFNTHIVLVRVRPADRLGDRSARSTRRPRRRTAATRSTAVSSVATRVTFIWRRDLTPAEQAAHSDLPADLQEGLRPHDDGDRGDLGRRRSDPNAGLQLALQSGEGRAARRGRLIVGASRSRRAPGSTPTTCAAAWAAGATRPASRPLLRRSRPCIPA